MLNACPLSADLETTWVQVHHQASTRTAFIGAFRRRNWSGCATSLCVVERRNAQ